MLEPSRRIADLRLETLGSILYLQKAQTSPGLAGPYTSLLGDMYSSNSPGG